MKVDIHGLVSGGIYYGAIIEECYNESKIDVEGTPTYLGGVVGSNQQAQIYKCFNISDIVAYHIGGGILGGNWGGTIKECYNLGNITSSNYMAGGISGSSDWSSSIITNCYNKGEIEASYMAGGIVANNTNCFNCYSIGTIEGTTSNSRGTIIANMSGSTQLIHVFGRNGDNGTLTEEELADEQKIITYISSPAKVSYGEGDTTQIGYKCDVLTDDEMKTQDFVHELNILIEAPVSGKTQGVISETTQSVWKMDTEGINDGYPIFTWQKKIATE